MEGIGNEQPIDDASLAQRIARGPAAEREACLEILYARYADPLFAIIHHRMSGSAETADVWQETWLAALRGIESYRGQSGLFTWLCGIARRKISDHFRRTGRRVGRITEAPIDSLDIGGGPLPEEVLARREIRLRVVEILAALPDDYRAALTARYADGYGVEEVARRIGRPYKAAESLLSRAKEAFRSKFMSMERSDERIG